LLRPVPLRRPRCVDRGSGEPALPSRPRSLRRRSGLALCCADPGMGMTHGGRSTAEMLLITGVLSGPPPSSERHRSRGSSGTFEDHLRGSVQSQSDEPASLMTFGAAFPDAFRPVPPDVSAGLPLLGLSKIAPPSNGCAESTPGVTLAGLAFGPEQPAPIAFRPRGFPPPRRFSPPSHLPTLAGRLPTMGFAAFPTLAKSHSRDAPPPCRALLPRGSAARGVTTVGLGCRSVRAAMSPCRPGFTRHLASSPLRAGSWLSPAPAAVDLEAFRRTGSRTAAPRFREAPALALLGLPTALPPDRSRTIEGG
jgi:hypothetical protein